MAQTTAQTPKGRFASRTEEEIIKLLKQKGSKITQQVTKNAVKTLREFCKFEEQKVKRRCALSRRCSDSVLMSIILNSFNLKVLTFFQLEISFLFNYV